MTANLAAHPGAPSSGRSPLDYADRSRDRTVELLERTTGPPRETGVGHINPPSGPALFTFAEAAARMRVPERTLRLLVARHEPPVIKAGRRVLFDELAINHLIESLRCRLKIVTLPTTRMLWLSGTIRGQRIRESTGTDNPVLAEERRAVREAEVYRAGIHGLKMVRPFADVALNYLKRPRSDDTRWRLRRFLVWLRREGLEAIRCDAVDQELLDKAYERMLRADATDSTRLREVVSPVRAVLRHGAIRGWCASPVFEVIRQPKGRKEWLTPPEAEAIIAASPPHLAPLFEFMFCAGPRRGEVLRLDWQHVQLCYGRATLRDIKARTGEVKDRILDLEPRAVEALAGLMQPGPDGPVFRREDGTSWHSDPRVSGAQAQPGFPGRRGPSYRTPGPPAHDAPQPGRRGTMPSIRASRS